MLYILYGAASEMGSMCREYLKAKGLELIDKYSYCKGSPIIESRYGKRNYLSRRDFEKLTDSLFRYNVSNVEIGFDWAQITNAVYSDGIVAKKSKLLTLSTSNIDMLRKIKSVYPNDVKIIYCYIDTVCLESMFSKIPNISPEEYGVRMSMGKIIKDSYANNTDIFDHVVIYCGESSAFDYKALYKQFDSIIDEESEKSCDVCVCEKHDIFISCSNESADFARELIGKLKDSNLNVISSSKIAVEDDFKQALEQNIAHSKVYLPIFSNQSIKSKSFKNEFNMALAAANNNGTLICPIIFDDNDHNYKNIFQGTSNQVYCINSDDYDFHINVIKERFIYMFNVEIELQELSQNVEQCISTGLIKQAAERQGKYVVALRSSNYLWQRDNDVTLIFAMLKYCHLLLLSEDIGKAIDYMERTMTLISDYKPYYGKIAELLHEIDCSINDNHITIKKIISKVPKGMALNLEKKLGTMSTQLNENSYATVCCDPLSGKIAAYGKAAIELFDELYKRDTAPGFKEALLMAYDRILGYCKTVKLGNDVSVNCIERISELKKTPSDRFQDVSSEGENNLQSLKVYLGQALPDTGKFDVFISHKSADDNIASRVYDYLKQSGRVVFCDHYTLGEMHDAKYDKRIRESLDNSKHLIVIASDPDYLKSGWVHDEWHGFYNDLREKNRNEGNLILILSDDLLKRKKELPPELRDDTLIIKTSEFRNEIDKYLW